MVIKECPNCGDWDIVERESSCVVGVWLEVEYECNECGYVFRIEYEHCRLKDDWIPK